MIIEGVCWVLLNGFKGGGNWKCDKEEEGVKRDWFYVSTYLSPCILNAKCHPTTHTPKHHKTLNNSINFIVEMTKNKGFIDFIMVLLPFFMCKDQYEQFYGFPLQINTHTHTHIVEIYIISIISLIFFYINLAFFYHCTNITI